MGFLVSFFFRRPACTDICHYHTSLFFFHAITLDWFLDLARFRSVLQLLRFARALGVSSAMVVEGMELPAHALGTCISINFFLYHSTCFLIFCSPLQRFVALVLQDLKLLQGTRELLSVTGSLFFGGEAHAFAFQHVPITEYPVVC